MAEEAIPSSEAAHRLGVSVTTFHKLTQRHDMRPVFAGAGSRGVRFWSPADVDRLAEERRAILQARLDRLDQAAS
jgi:hypothetical protein